VKDILKALDEPNLEHENSDKSLVSDFLEETSSFDSYDSH